MKHVPVLRSAAILVLFISLVSPLVAEPGSGTPDGATPDGATPASAAPRTETAALEAPSLETQQIRADVLSSIDSQAEPCEDFYRYACGSWLDSTQMPADQTRWGRSFSVIQERNRQIVRDVLEDAAASAGDHPERRLIGDYYASCMDAAAIDKAGAKPLAPLLAEIAKVEDATSLMKLTGKLHRHFVGAFFQMAVLSDFKDPDLSIAFLFQGGLGMPDRDYYVAEDDKKQQLMADYETHVARMLQLLGESSAEASEHAAQIVAFETRLAEASRPRAAMRVIEKLYNKIDISGLRDLTPKLPWNAYLGAIGYPEVVDISVATPEFFEALNSIVLETDPAVLRTYLRWHLVNGAAEALSDDFVAADFEFYGQKLQGQQQIQPRWKRCVESTEQALGEATGKLYVERQFAGSSKAVALEMIHDIESAFETALPELSWMDDVTRSRAVEKAKAVGNKIGYPDEWRDYSSMNIVRDDYFANVMAAQAFEYDRTTRRIGQAVDPDEWRMNPQMVNAYYTPLQNEIVFPAGILQPPFFHKDFPAAMNYGGIGAVMGHELSHGFDDQGRKFDPNGQLREWWQPQATERFQEQAQCVDDLYSGYEIEPGARVNGKLTLGENIADIGGVKQAYSAYKSWESRHGVPEPMIEGLSNDQLFFVAYGQVWCSLSTPEQARLRLTTDSHSPARFRVNGPVSNNPDFAKVFSCAEGTQMNPEDSCEVW